MAESTRIPSPRGLTGEDVAADGNWLAEAGDVMISVAGSRSTVFAFEVDLSFGLELRDFLCGYCGVPRKLCLWGLVCVLVCGFWSVSLGLKGKLFGDFLGRCKARGSNYILGWVLVNVAQAGIITAAKWLTPVKTWVSL